MNTIVGCILGIGLAILLHFLFELVQGKSNRKREEEGGDNISPTDFP